MLKTARRVAAVHLLGVALLTGCATTSGTGPTVSRSGFDNARVVAIDGHGNACKGAVCTGLGAQWSSHVPSEALLVVVIFNEIQAITGAQLNIDGQVIALTNMRDLTDLSHFAGMKKSQKAFAVPLETVRKIAASKRTWLRVTTPQGSALEDAVIDGTTDSKAYHALRRFLAAVDQT
jgi:predicted small secreted protein